MTMAVTELATTNRIMFFMILRSIFLLLSIAMFRLSGNGYPSSSVFFSPVRMHPAFVRLLVQKLFLSGFRSCIAKIQFPPAIYFLLFALPLYPSAALAMGVL